MTLAFEEHGIGVPLVLLHAFPLSRGMWEPQIDELSSASIRLILPDLTGFGETPLAGSVSVIEKMAEGVAGLLDRLQVTKAFIGGLSMGGYVTFDLFRLRPDLFSGLILCDTTSSADTDEKRSGRYKLIDKIEEKGQEALIEMMLPALLGETTKRHNAGLVSAVAEMFRHTLPAASIAAMRGMADRLDNTALLSAIKKPTLFIFGKEDVLTPPELGVSMSEKISGSQLCLIDGAGHYSNLEQPGRFNEAVISFLDAHR